LPLARVNAFDRALEVVKAGLSSGAIKLQGSNFADGNNAQQLKSDTHYLNELINSIAENLIEKTKRD